jgi:type VI protein secretion system component Hcp
MASWILVPCLVKLRSEFNAIAPNRDKSSDGSIGDAAHQDSQSDHNDDEIGNVPIRDADKIHEVHALDVDVDLRVPGLSMEIVVQFLLARCRSGAERRLRYIIYNRRIWSASNDWRKQDYDGANPHDHHAHFSSSYTTSLEASTASWHLEDIPVALTADDKKWLSAEIVKQVKVAVDGLAEALAGDLAGVPAATATAVWNKTRTDVRPPWSDTARNLLGAEITEAVVDGVAIARFPANQGK